MDFIFWRTSMMDLPGRFGRHWASRVTFLIGGLSAAFGCCVDRTCWAAIACWADLTGWAGLHVWWLCISWSWLVEGLNDLSKSLRCAFHASWGEVVVILIVAKFLVSVILWDGSLGLLVVYFHQHARPSFSHIKEIPVLDWGVPGWTANHSWYFRSLHAFWQLKSLQIRVDQILSDFLIRKNWREATEHYPQSLLFR